VVERRVWGWRLLTALPLTLFFLVIDLSFFGANIVKIADGGWFPLAVAAFVYLLMSTWKKGRSVLGEQLAKGTLPFDEFIANVRPGSPPRVPGTAIFMARDPDGTPTALLHNLKHNKVLHERVILLTVLNEEIPTVPRKERVTVEPLGKEFYRVIARYGFVENPSVPEVIELARAGGLDLSLMTTTFFLSRETLIASRSRGMSLWRDRLFALMAKNALRPTDFFRIPPNRVIELGMQVKI
jgi:KUP system potassium uptake protein